jgi:hypothetical protein
MYRNQIFLFYICVLFPLILGFQVSPEFTTWVGCISRHEAKAILGFLPKNELLSDLSITSSIDLSQSQSPLILTTEGLCVNSRDTLLATYEELKEIANKGQDKCFSLYDDGSKPWHISTLSKSSGIPASLCPPLASGGAPTMVLGGFTMHRIAGDNMNPMIDTTAKISCLKFFPGACVLDTCMGLGYTAIGAGRKVKGTGSKVVTIEYDDASIEIAAHNPWSKQLFDGSLGIEVIKGDACEQIKAFESGTFNFVIHDPPARALSRTDIYGLDFYIQLRRVLSTGGSLFHYIGNPDSKESGRLYKGIATRLQTAGFSNVKIAREAFGLIATAS